MTGRVGKTHGRDRTGSVPSGSLDHEERRPVRCIKSQSGLAICGHRGETDVAMSVGCIGQKPFIGTDIAKILLCGPGNGVGVYPTVLMHERRAVGRVQAATCKSGVPAASPIAAAAQSGAGADSRRVIRS